MARIRTIKPTFFTSTTIADLPVEARLTFIGLWTYVDDHGRGADDARLVKAAIWPLDDRVTAKVVEGHLASLELAHLITRYTVDGKAFLHIRTWLEHQRVSHPQKSQFPEPFAQGSAAIPERSGAVRESFRKPPEPDGNVPEALRPEVEGKGKEEPSSSSPSDSRPEPVEPVEEEEDFAEQENPVDVLIRAACELIATDELRSFQLRKPDQAPPARSDREELFLSSSRRKAWSRHAERARKLLADRPHLDAFELAAELGPRPAPPTSTATNHEDLVGAAQKRRRDEAETYRAQEEELARVDAERKARAEELLAKMSTEDRKALRADVVKNLGPTARPAVVESAMRVKVLELEQAS